MWACTRGCIIGRREIEDEIAIQQMVDLLAVDPSLGVEGAAAIAARGMKGKLSTHIERLRKKYRKRKRAGTLPKAATWLERREADLREYLRIRKDDIVSAKRLLVDTEREAESLGVDTSREDLFEYTQVLAGRKEHLQMITRDSLVFAGSWFVDQGLTDPDAAVSRLRQAAEELEQIEKQIDVIRRLRTLRSMAGRPT